MALSYDADLVIIGAGKMSSALNSLADLTGLIVLLQVSMAWSWLKPTWISIPRLG